MAKKRSRSNRPRQRPEPASARPGSPSAAPPAGAAGPADSRAGATDLAVRPADDSSTGSADAAVRPADGAPEDRSPDSRKASGRRSEARQNQKQKQPKQRRPVPIAAPAGRDGASRLPEARVTKGVAREPVFWFGFEVAWAKLVVFRFVFFGMLALDALLQIRHAPRYGANDFNVGQLPLLDGLGAGRVGYGVGQLVIAYALVLVAAGVATRVLLPLAAILYAWLYFGSQLDAYQHHYLVALVLAIASFAPWQRPREAEARTPVQSWALRLLLVQLAIMYLWAAISKLDPAWVDGRTLATQVGGALRSVIDKTIGFQVTAIAVIGVELALAGTVWLRRAWPVAAPLGLLFHLGIVATGLEIGLFAWLMVALYILVIPDRAWIWLAERPAISAVRRRLRRAADATGWTKLGIALAAAIVLAILVRTPYATGLAIAACLVPLASGARAVLAGRAPRVVPGIAHLAAIVMMLVVDRASTVTEDYYRYWAGSQRRLKNPDAAERAYRGLVEIAPDDPVGHFQLGKLLLAAGDTDDGLAQLHEAQALDPEHARAWLEEARWLAKQGRTAEAIDKAKQGVTAEPASGEARALLDSLSRAAPVPAPRVDPDP